MAYKTIMVHLDLEDANEPRLEVASDLAERFGAKLIGITACEYSQGPYFAYGEFAEQVIDQARIELNKQMADMEADFRQSLHNRSLPLEWRSALEMPTRYVARQARAADIIVTAQDRKYMLSNPLRRLDPSALVVQAGRPVLITPSEGQPVAFDNILVAWKDTREARRAVWDSLPLLQQATDVGVVEILEGDQDPKAAQSRVDDVVAWLATHGVKVSGRVRSAPDGVAAQLDLIAADTGADIVVAGAYGHARFGEWAFGGVTHDRLTRSARCSLLSH